MGYNINMSDDVLIKFNAHGQWTLTKHRVLPAIAGGVPADFPRPDVGPRGHQGKMQATADDTHRPEPQEVRVGRKTGENTRVSAESIPADRGGQNTKRFGPNGEKLD